MTCHKHPGVRTIGRGFFDLAARQRDEAVAENVRLREALEDYASHQSWRCGYPPHFYLVDPPAPGDCACGLNRTLRELGLAEALEAGER